MDQYFDNLPIKIEVTCTPTEEQIIVQVGFTPPDLPARVVLNLLVTAVDHAARANGFSTKEEILKAFTDAYMSMPEHL